MGTEEKVGREIAELLTPGKINLHIALADAMIRMRDIGACTYFRQQLKEALKDNVKQKVIFKKFVLAAAKAKAVKNI